MGIQSFWGSPWGPEETRGGPRPIAFEEDTNEIRNGNWEVGNWSVFRKLEVKIQAPEVERRKLFSKFWKLDVGAGHLNTFSTQKRARKSRQTAVFKRGNLL